MPQKSIDYTDRSGQLIRGRAKLFLSTSKKELNLKMSIAMSDNGRIKFEIIDLLGMSLGIGLIENNSLIFEDLQKNCRIIINNLEFKLQRLGLNNFSVEDIIEWLTPGKSKRMILKNENRKTIFIANRLSVNQLTETSFELPAYELYSRVRWISYHESFEHKANIFNMNVKSDPCDNQERILFFSEAIN